MKEFLILFSSVIVFLLLSFCLYLFIIKPGGRRDEMKKYCTLKYAHRGLHDSTRAENSISAFRAAVDQGYAIELDVRLSSDGELVVFHDDTLDRVTKESGRVDAKSAEELSKIRLLDTDDGIPTFREVLELVDGKVPLLVEIKEDAGKYGVTEKTVEMLSAYKGEYVVESFNPLALARVRKLKPRILRGFLSQDFLKERQYRSLTYFLLQHMLLNVVCRPDFIAFRHSHYKNPALRMVRRIFGTPTLAWTVQSEADERAAYAHGFDGVIFEQYIPASK